MGKEQVPGYRSEPQVDPNSGTRDLRRDEARDRQLAMGRRAVLSAHRQADGEARHRNRDPVQGAAAAAVPPDRRQANRAERAGAAHPARRGNFAELQRQDSGPGGQARRRRHELQVRRLLWRRTEHRLRDAAARLHDRRPDPVPARRHGRRGMARSRSDSRCMESDPATDFPNYAAGSWGPHAADELLERDGRKWREI